MVPPAHLVRQRPPENAELITVYNTTERAGLDVSWSVGEVNMKHFSAADASYTGTLKRLSHRSSKAGGSARQR